MTTGIIIAIMLVLLVSNLIMRKVRNIEVRKIGSKVHKVLGVIFIIVILIHLITTLPLMKQRPIMMYVLGFMMLFAAVLELVLFLARKKLKGSWLKAHRIVAIILFLCMLVHIGVGIGSLKSYQKKIAAIKVEEVDLSQVEDGTYLGICDAGYVYAKVEVTVKDGQITKVDLLEHRTERGQKAEVLTDQMVEKQEIALDAVSSATNSSKVIEQAVVNALMEHKN